MLRCWMRILHAKLLTSGSRALPSTSQARPCCVPALFAGCYLRSMCPRVCYRDAVVKGADGSVAHIVQL